MTDQTLDEVIKQLKDSTPDEIKLPSGEVVKTETDSLITSSSASSDQMKEMKNIPTIDIPSEEDGREE